MNKDKKWSEGDIDFLRDKVFDLTKELHTLKESYFRDREDTWKYFEDLTKRVEELKRYERGYHS